MPSMNRTLVTIAPAMDAFTSMYSPARNAAVAEPAIARLEKVAVEHGNLFEALMETTKVCSLGQISQALYRVGGQYRRSM